jgi:hypothetical protein
VTSGQTIDFKSTPWVAPSLKETILGLMQKPTLDTPSNNPVEQLRVLAELHQTGALTDEEFASKKEELLKRI